MNKTQHILLLAMEECGEVAHRFSKAIRFGLDDVEDGQELTAAERIKVELTDLYAILEMLKKETGLDAFSHLFDPRDSEVRAKRDKVEKYMKLSRQLVDRRRCYAGIEELQGETEGGHGSGLRG